MSIAIRFGASLFAIALAAPAFAQDAPPASEEAGYSEDIVVTATKRPTRIQDVPISMTVLSGETIEQQSIGNLEEMSRYTPNLTIADTSVTTNIYMRGIGSGLDRGFEQSVGMFIDGIYMGRSKQYRAPMFDLDHIEVLRGPQPVIFGKNTTVGAIQLQTRRAQPGEAFSAEFTGEYEFRNNGRKITSVISGGPGPTLGLRGAFLYEKSDGFSYNSFLDRKDPGIEQWIARISGVWEPTDNLTIDAKYEHNDFKGRGSLGEMRKISKLNSGNALFDIAADRLLFGPTGAFALDPQLEDKVNFRRSSDDTLGPQATEQRIDNVAVSATLEGERHTLTAVFGYSAYEYVLDNDIDYLPVPLLQQRASERFDQFSGEIRLASNSNEGFLDYLGGVYWQTSDLNNFGATTVNFAYLGPLVPLPTGLTPISSFTTGTNYGLKTETVSPFAQVGFKLGGGLKILLGGRYSYERKEVDRPGFCNKLDGRPLDPTFISDALARNSGLCPSLVTFSRSRSERHFMPSAQLQWKVSDDVSAYAKWDRGYKSGGFNAANFATLADVEYNEERADGYEIGVKTSFADRRAGLNIALFNTKYRDLQVTTLTGNGQALLSNAGQATSRGVEVDGFYNATDNFKIGGSFAYLDSKYDRYTDGPCNALQRSAHVGLPGPCFQDLSGKPTSYAPEWSGSFFAEGKVPLSSGIDLSLRGDATYSDSYFYDSDLDPNTRQSSYWKFDARLGIASQDGKWDVAILGKNLTNKAIAVWGTDVPLLLGTYVAFTSMPRTVAVQARFRFGG